MTHDNGLKRPYEDVLGRCQTGKAKKGPKMQIIIQDAIIRNGFSYCRECSAGGECEALFRKFTFIDDDEELYCNGCNRGLSQSVRRRWSA